jgi:hypothetical protein
MAKALITLIQLVIMKNKELTLKEILALSQWLGTDLDYSKIKIYGRGLDDLKKENIQSHSINYTV